MIPVRLATPDDFPGVLDLCHHLHRGTAVGHAVPGTLDAARLERLGQAALAQGSLWVGAEGDEAPCAFLLALADAHPFTGTPFGEELGWWVEPAQRGRTLGVRLLVHAIDWARRQALPALFMAAPIERPDIGVFLVRAGFVPVQTTYVLRLGA